MSQDHTRLPPTRGEGQGQTAGGSASTAARDMLIKAGVRNLREYGYPDVTAENITTDQIYSAFFASMLADNKGRGLDAEIEALLAEIAHPPGGNSHEG